MKNKQTLTVTCHLGFYEPGETDICNDEKQEFINDVMNILEGKTPEVYDFRDYVHDDGEFGYSIYLDDELIDPKKNKKLVKGTIDQKILWENYDDCINDLDDGDCIILSTSIELTL